MASRPQAKSFTDRIRDRRFSAMHEFKCIKDRERERDAYDKQREKDRASDREIARLEFVKIVEKTVPADDIRIENTLKCLVDIFELFKVDPRSTCPFSADSFRLGSFTHHHVEPILKTMGIGVRDVLSKTGKVDSKILFCLPEHRDDTPRPQYTSESSISIVNGGSLHCRTQQWLSSRAEALGGGLANWIEQAYDTDDSDDGMQEYCMQCGAHDYLVAEHLNKIFMDDDVCFKAEFQADQNNEDWVKFMPHAWPTAAAVKR